MSDWGLLWLVAHLSKAYLQTETKQNPMAKKNKRKNIKKRLKQQAYSKMSQRLKDSGQKVVHDPKGQVKMSKVLLEFAEPLLESCEDEDDSTFEQAIMMSILCWNLAMLPEDKLEQKKNDLMNALFKSDSESRATAQQTINMLLERKQKYFADIKRLIMDYEIVSFKNERRVNVASTLAE